MRLLADPMTPMQGPPVHVLDHMPDMPTGRGRRTPVMPALPAPEPLAMLEQQRAPEPQPQPQQAPSFGLGGLGGMPQEGGGNTFLQSLGASLMSSPGNHMLRDFPAYQAAFQQQSQARQEQAAKRQALAHYMRSRGMSDDEIAVYVNSPEMADRAIADIERREALAREEADRAHDANLLGSVWDGASTQPQPGTSVMPRNEGQRPQRTMAPNLNPTPEEAAQLIAERRQGAQAGAGGTMPAQPQEVAQAAPQAAMPGENAGAFSVTDPQVDTLLRQRENAFRRKMELRTDTARKGMDDFISQIDKRLDQIAPTSMQKEYVNAQRQNMERGLPVQTQDEWDAARAELRRPQTNVNIGGQEGSFASTVGTGVAERVMATLDDAQAQAERLNSYERIGNLLIRPEVYTGTGAEQIANLKRMASTLLGIEGIEGVSDIDAAERIRTELFAGFRQEMLRGATSNADREFIMRIPPNLGDSAEGLRLTIEMQRRSAEAARDRAEILRDLIDRSPNGNLTLRDWNEYQRQAAQIDIFDEADMNRIREVARNNAKQSGPLAGLPLEHLSGEALDMALDGTLTVEEVQELIRLRQGRQ